MANQTRRVAVFPGTFDPFTNGHLDVVQRGRKIFDELVVAVGNNPDKQTWFTQQERTELIRTVVQAYRNVRVEPFDGLTVDYARKIGAAVILRGIRNSADVQHEFQVALTNRVVAGVETVFIMTTTDFAFTSSSLIKQIAYMGGDVSALVPAVVHQAMKAKAVTLAGNDNHLEEPA